MTPAPKEPQKTRDLILSTALRLFSERGYFATSVHDIRRSANLSIGSIYHHFDSKESIARAIYDDLISRMTTVVEEAAATATNTKGKCRAIIASLFACRRQVPLWCTSYPWRYCRRHGILRSPAKGACPSLPVFCLPGSLCRPHPPSPKAVRLLSQHLQ